jgi:hypothetical protein
MTLGETAWPNEPLPVHREVTGSRALHGLFDNVRLYRMNDRKDNQRFHARVRHGVPQPFMVLINRIHTEHFEQHRPHLINEMSPAL